MDCLFVVGDPKSNNSNKLKEIALNHKIQQVYLIESALDIEESWIAQNNRIAVTSGASTPTYLTNQVISTLNHYAHFKILLKPEIDIAHLLD